MAENKVTYSVNLDGNILDKFKEINKAYDDLNKKISGGLTMPGKPGGSAGGGLGGFAQMGLGLGGLAIGATAAIKALGAIKDAAMATIDKFAEFQQIKNVLQTTFSSKFLAESEFSRLQDFAAKTPFQLDNLAKSYTKLVNRGFKPTNKELTQLGDLAASTGKDFDQVAEALLDAETGEFERLKELGIKAKVNGDKVKLSFKGQTQEINNSADAIRNYITSLGSLGGVSGSMANSTITIKGKESNLSDTWDQFTSNIGERLNPIYSSLLDIAANTLGTMNAVLKKNGQEKVNASKASLSGYLNALSGAQTDTERRILIQQIQQKFGKEWLTYAQNAGGGTSGNLSTYITKSGKIDKRILGPLAPGGAFEKFTGQLWQFQQGQQSYQAKVNEKAELQAENASIKQKQLEGLSDELKAQYRTNPSSVMGSSFSSGAVANIKYNESKIKDLQKDIDKLAPYMYPGQILGESLERFNSITGETEAERQARLKKEAAKKQAEEDAKNAKTLVNAAPSTFNVYITELGKVEHVEILTTKDEEAFKDMLQNTLVNAFNSISANIKR